MTTAYYPHTDSQSECSNKTIKTVIYIFIASLGEGDLRKWLDYNSTIAFIHNSIKNTITGFTFYKLLLTDTSKEYIDIFI